MEGSLIPNLYFLLLFYCSVFYILFGRWEKFMSQFQLSTYYLLFIYFEIHRFLADNQFLKFETHSFLFL